MAAAEPIDGLGFDKIVFDCLVRASESGGRDAHMDVVEAEETTGLNRAQILRAVSMVRAKGYPVISMSARRTYENGFRIPASSKEYVEWRSKLVEDLKLLQQILLVGDAAAKARFGEDMPVEQFLF